ncbi:hypothetical protein DW881_09840 [Exiguobacterium sp. AM39-5BH]|nr:hypothetical protein DW881_09840 [Exiguobacterium sp. AM39-5BH]
MIDFTHIRRNAVTVIVETKSPGKTRLMFRRTYAPKSRSEPRSFLVCIYMSYGTVGREKSRPVESPFY